MTGAWTKSRVRMAVRLAFSTHIRGLVPASNVNWLADVRSKVSEVRSKVSFTLSARLWRQRLLVLAIPAV
jgi:hypothetical protein